MKKTISLILALVLCLSLCACSNSQTFGSSSQVSSDALIGTWVCEREAGEDRVSAAHTKTIELYKGGNCYGYDLVVNNGEFNNYTGKWELEDGILTITLATGAIIGYKLNTTTTPFTLTKQIDTSVVLVKK